MFDTLCVLVEHAGRLVTKHELLEAVWPDTTVEENNLNHNISVLRKALGEKATGQQYIETVPRLGYRFVAAVEADEPEVPATQRPRNSHRDTRLNRHARRGGDARPSFVRRPHVIALVAAIRSISTSARALRDAPRPSPTRTAS